MQIRTGDRSRQVLGQVASRVARGALHHATARQDHRILRVGQRFGCGGDLLGIPGPALERQRGIDVGGDVAVEIVARDVDLHRAHFGLGDVERAAQEFGHALGAIDLHLPLGDLREDRQLLGFLKTAEADAEGSDCRRADDHRRVRPVCRGHAGDEVGDARAVLRDDETRLARDPAHAVGHVHGVLLVRHRQEANARRRKEIERIHVRRADDPRHERHAFDPQRFDERLARRHAGRRADASVGRERAVSLGFSPFDHRCSSMRVPGPKPIGLRRRVRSAIRRRARPLRAARAPWSRRCRANRRRWRRRGPFCDPAARSVRR